MKLNIEEIVKKNKYLMVCFYSDDCIHCDSMEQTVRTVNHEIGIRFVEINVGVEKELALKYSITHTPTMLIFKDGELVKRFVGSEDNLEQLKYFFLL